MRPLTFPLVGIHDHFYPLFATYLFGAIKLMLKLEHNTLHESYRRGKKKGVGHSVLWKGRAGAASGRSPSTYTSAPRRSAQMWQGAAARPL